MLTKFAQLLTKVWVVDVATNGGYDKHGPVYITTLISPLLVHQQFENMNHRESPAMSQLYSYTTRSWVVKERIPGGIINPLIVPLFRMPWWIHGFSGQAISCSQLQLIWSNLGITAEFHPTQTGRKIQARNKLVAPTSGGIPVNSLENL